MSNFIGVEISRKSIDKYQLALLKSYGELQDFEKKFITTLANEIMKKAMPRTPVDTGRLRRSYKVSKIKTKGNDLEIEVYNDAKSDGAGESYASYVEFGHFTRNRVRYINGIYMLTVSTDEVQAEMQRVWNILFTKWAKRMGL